MFVSSKLQLIAKGKWVFTSIESKNLSKIWHGNSMKMVGIGSFQTWSICYILQALIYITSDFIFPHSRRNTVTKGREKEILINQWRNWPERKNSVIIILKKQWREIVKVVLMNKIVRRLKLIQSKNWTLYPMLSNWYAEKERSKSNFPTFRLF